MIRYLQDGYRNFQLLPDPYDIRNVWEFYVVSQGTVCPEIKHAEGNPPQANFYVMPPHLSYRWVAPRHKVIRTLFQYAEVPTLLEKVVGKFGFLAKNISREECRKVRALAQDLKSDYITPSEMSGIKFDHALYALTLIALRDIPMATAQRLDCVNANRVDRVLAWYVRHLAARPTLEQAAEAVSLSSSQLRRIFHAVRQCSPHRAFLQARLDHASTLLATTDSTLDAIASQSGFVDATDFCRVFKKYRSFTPDRWRRSLSWKEDNASIQSRKRGATR